VSDHIDEKGALENIRDRALTKAPMASEAMLRKVFGSFVDDIEFRLVIFAIWPLYSEEEHDRDKTLETIRSIVFNAQSHSKSSLLIQGSMLIKDDLYSPAEKYFDYRERLPSLRVPTLILAGDKDWITPIGMFAQPTRLGLTSFRPIETLELAH
jgi:pimeloyl-ACP methyl ester carboxylesterase